jgi:hypothetical protein
MKRTVFTGICVAGALAASAFAQSAKPQLTATSKVAAPGGNDNPGELIWEQLPLGTQGFASQDFEAAFNIYDIQCFMDFSTTQDWLLGTTFASAFNTATGNGAVTTDVNAEIWNGLPFNAGTMVAQSVPGLGVDNTGGANGQGNISTDFGGECLPTGDYWYSIQIVRDFGTGGQAFVFGLQPMVGAQDVQYNPGLGFGLCNGVWCDVQDTAGVKFDVNFTLTGKPGTCGGCAFDPCDTNCDNVVDAFDIEPFISVLLGNPGCSPCAADVNGDMVVDAFDIEPFIACLVGP